MSTSLIRITIAFQKKQGSVTHLPSMNCDHRDHMAPVYEAITSVRLVIETNLHIDPESLAWLYAATFNFSMINCLKFSNKV